MRIIDLNQGSEEWLTYRQNHLGATDASIIMNPSRYNTRVGLWQQKTLGWEKSHSAEEMERMEQGTMMEPLARGAFQEEVGIEVFPAVVEHDIYPFLSASLDGISADHSVTVEIKCGKKAFMLAQLGEISPYYYTQCQHQMMITALDWTYFYCYLDGQGILMKINRNDEYLRKLLEMEKKFWHCVANFIEPEEIYETAGSF